MDADGILQRMITSIGGKTQADLGKALGVAQASISDAKRKGKIPSEWFLKLSARNGLNPNWLLTGKGPMSIPEENVRLFDVTLLKRVIEVVEKRLEKGKPKLSPERKAQLIGIVYEQVMKDKSLEGQVDHKVEELLKLVNG